MALTQIDDRGLKTPIDLLDNEKIRLGTGNDLELYHSGSASYIDAGTTATELISDDLRLRSKTGNETYINADVNGAVELYHDNTLRFLTNSIGAQCQGDFSIPLDNEELRIGAGNDFRVKHDGTNTIMSNNTGALYISGDDIRLTNAATDESYIKGVANGAVELYYDNSKKFETISTGVKVQSSAAHCHLKINSANSNSSVIHFGTAADDDMAQIWYDDYSDALYYRTSTNTPQIFYTNNAERMRIDSSGNVGIGTTSPRSLLDLGAGSGDGALSSTLSQYQIMLEAPQGEGDYGRNIGWSVGTNGLTAAINAVDVGAGDATGLTFITGTNSSVAERMRIDSSGNVGIGEATPLAQLHIKPATNKSQLLLEQNNAVDGYALFQDGPNGGHLKFMRHVNGTETQKLLLRNDGGLCFGTDSATANALDDYEEGTWTPAVWSGIDGGAQYLSLIHI